MIELSSIAYTAKNKVSEFKTEAETQDEVSENENIGSKRLISQANSDYVLSSLREAVLRGTGYRANSLKIEIAGKTGAAHKSGGNGYSASKYTASFASIGPLSNRKYTVIVVIDEPDPNKYFGGEVAAPIAKSLFEDLLSI